MGREGGDGREGYGVVVCSRLVVIVHGDPFVIITIALYL